ncbi:unnamed protein product [Rotaria sp. Silwood2]|nr:unnamed protein product [Rotaria sp. Silwood2]CAF4073304.1 unnamed protein product [Rotaria sp. Silwood2]
MSDNINATSRQDMITYLTQEYNENQATRKLIDEFDQDYERSSSIHWYTKGTFLYRLLNEALRDSDFDALFALRSFIVDLYKQILLEHEQFRNNNLTSRYNFSLNVYRGQAISREELSILLQKQGDYFSMQSFLSTSTNSEVAHVYSGAGTAHTDLNKVWILYEFKIDTHLNNTKPYARISHLSQYQDGAVFRIDSIRLDDVNQRWHALLSLCDDERFDLYGIMQQYAAEIIVDRVSPGFLLYQQGDYAKAREYFQKILNITSLEDREKAHCYRGLGAVAAEENNYDEAYKNFTEEYDIWHKLDDEVNRLEVCKNIGDILFYMGKFKEALEYLPTTFAYFKLKDYEMEYARICGMIGHIMDVNEQ